jgi:hypothetical protein
MWAEAHEWKVPLVTVMFNRDNATFPKGCCSTFLPHLIKMSKFHSQHKDYFLWDNHWVATNEHTLIIILTFMYVLMRCKNPLIYAIFSKNIVRQAILFPFYWRRNWGSEQLYDLLRVTQTRITNWAWSFYLMFRALSTTHILPKSHLCRWTPKLKEHTKAGFHSGQGRKPIHH